MNTSIQGLLTVIAVLALGGCAAPRDPEPPPPPPQVPVPVVMDPFPVPDGLRPQVDFWRQVYGTWSLGQVVIHDDRHLDLIYEIADLPGPVSDGYTAAQRDFIDRRKALWQERLQALARKTLAGEPLTAAEQDLARRLAASGASVFGADRRLRAQRGIRERFRRGLEISGRYDGLFREAFRQAGLPEDLAYLPHVESSFQNHARSSAGAVGMWQFTRPAARTYMTSHPALDERLDPLAACRGAARYLRHAYAALGDWSLALTSYNHGITGMQRARNLHGADFLRIVRHYDHPSFGFASRNFYAEFLAARQVAADPLRFFPEGIRYELPLAWDRLVLDQDAPVALLARHYGLDPEELAVLNLAWTGAARSGQVALPMGTEVWLPAGTLTRTARAAAAADPALAMVNGAAAPVPPSADVKLQ
ncbi:MAG: lytic transglycosylase domain-containing protein [Pseudomonadota bacterium]|nr:lytic transglycosylase domain-containing protein [Pseudomonadota bacterium]